MLMETEKRAGKLMMLRGLPRSGKSTWAKEWVLTSGNWYRVNKDSLRTMLHADKWTPQNEKITMKAQDAIVRSLISSGKNVLIDDTNLGDYHHDRWQNIAKELGAAFEMKTFNADIAELVQRDEMADEKRGRHVIEKLALQYKHLTFSEKGVIVCDIDGTIADCEHRRHHLEGDKKNWMGFFSEMDKDTIVMSTAKLLSEYHHLDRKKILFVSARPEKYRKATEDWLAKHNMLPLRSSAYMFSSAINIPYEALLLRQDNDTRNDVIVKQEILDTYLDKTWIHTVIDDRPSVIEMWRSNGLDVIDVGDGVDF